TQAWSQQGCSRRASASRRLSSELDTHECKATGGSQDGELSSTRYPKTACFRCSGPAGAVRHGRTGRANLQRRGQLPAVVAYQTRLSAPQRPSRTNGLLLPSRRVAAGTRPRFSSSRRPVVTAPLSLPSLNGPTRQNAFLTAI